MKYIMISICSLFFLTIEAQQTPMFQTTIYFEDAIGNKDSIIYGYDTLANATYNPDFGELAIEVDTPFDSIFEVRAVHDELDIFWAENIRSKKVIGRALPTGGSWICEVFGASIGVEMYIKHRPLKVYWNSDDFYDICRINGLITNLTYGIYDVDVFENPAIQHGCLWNQDTVVFYLEPHPIGLDAYHRIDELEGGISDTIFGLFLGVAPMQSLTPCWNWIVPDSNEEPTPEELQTAVFPNPASASFTLESENKQLKRVEIYGVNGQLMRTFSFTDIETINTHEWATGLYFIKILNENGQTIAIRKLMKE